MPNPGAFGASVPRTEDFIVREIADLKRALRELSAARSLAASQIGSGGLLVNGGGSITIVAPGTLNVAGGIVSGGTLVATTSVSAGTDLVAGGNVITGTSGSLFSTYGRATPVVSSYVAAYFNVDGRLGATVSSRRFKQDILKWDAQTQALFALELYQFRYIAAVELYGDAAEVEIGVMAEDLHGLGLTWLVVYDEDGRPFTVKYERMALLLIPTIQDHERRLAALEA
jgi:hypothetical protein